MKISIPIVKEDGSTATNVTSTNVIDTTTLWDKSIYTPYYSTDIEYRYSNSIYRNTGEDYFVPTYLLANEGAYTLGDIIYKDGEVTQASPSTLPKAPVDYVPAPNTTLDISLWDSRYVKVQDTPPNFVLNQVSTIGSINRATRCKFSRDGLHAYMVTGALIEHYTLTVAYDLNTKTFSDSQSPSNASVVDIELNPTGTKMFVCYGHSTDEYTLNTPYQVGNSSMFRDGGVAHYALISSIAFSSDGSTFYVGRTYLGYIQQYNLGTSWSVLGTYVIDEAYQLYPDVSSNNTRILDIFIDTDDKTMYALYSFYSRTRLVKFQMATPHALASSTILDTRRISSTATGVTMNPNQEDFYLIKYGEALRHYCVSPGVINTAMHDPSNQPMEWLDGNILYSWVVEDGGTSFEMYDMSTYESLENEWIYETFNYYTLLDYNSIDARAIVYDTTYGTSNTPVSIWMPKTIIWNAVDGLFFGSNLPIIAEITTLGGFTYIPVESPGTLPGFSYIGANNLTRPLDNKNYTVASTTGTMEYTLEGLNSFDTIALGHIKGAHITLVFTLPVTSGDYDLWLDGVSVVSGGNGIITIIDDDINAARDSHRHLSDWYTTLIFYSDLIMEIGSTVEITITGTTIELGTLMLGMSADAGFTNLAIKNDYKDYSNFEYDDFGNADYTERAKVSRYSGSVDIFIEDYDMTDRLMTSLGKNLVIVNGSDYNSTSADSTSIFAATQKIGRFLSFSQKSLVKDNDISRMANYTFTLEEIV